MLSVLTRDQVITFGTIVFSAITLVYLIMQAREVFRNGYQMGLFATIGQWLMAFHIAVFGGLILANLLWPAHAISAILSGALVIANAIYLSQNAERSLLGHAIQRVIWFPTILALLFTIFNGIAYIT